VQGYSKEPLKMSRKEMYVSNGETLDSKIVSADKKADLHPIKENSKEQNEEIVDKDKGNYSFLNREISDDSSEENDLNNRVDWKMESPNKIIRPVTDQEIKKDDKPDLKPSDTINHINKMDKDAPSEIEEESDNS
jgi:hypothetical protein